MVYGLIREATPAALELAAEWERTGPLNPVLRPIDAYHPQGEESPDPVAQLKAAGFVEREGRVTEELLDVLPSLCRSSLEYIADFRVDNTRFTALAAVGAGAVFAVRERNDESGVDVVRFRELDEDELIDAMLDLLSLEPGSGQLVSVFLQDARDANEAITERRLSYEYKQLRAMLERPAAGPSIEITIGVRDSSGKHSYTRSPLHIARLDWGHFITYTTGEGHSEQFHGGPATSENIRKALAALRATLPG